MEHLHCYHSFSIDIICRVNCAFVYARATCGFKAVILPVFIYWLILTFSSLLIQYQFAGRKGSLSSM